MTLAVAMVLGLLLFGQVFVDWLSRPFPDLGDGRRLCKPWHDSQCDSDGLAGATGTGGILTCTRRARRPEV